VPEAVAPPPGIAAITVPSPFAIGAVNAYLLEGDPLTLVDPGPNQEESLAALEAGLAERGRRVEDIELVLLTHQHHDHVGLADRVRERSGASVAAIAPLAAFLADFEASMDADDAYAVAMMRRHGVAADVARRLNELSRSWRGVGGGVAVDRVLADGETVVAGGRALDVHVRPGHSPTDTVFHDAAAGVLVGGDHLLERVSSNPIAHAPVGVADPAAAAASADRPRPLIDYLESFARTRPLEVSLVLPGHGPPFSAHRAVIDQRVQMHRRRAERVLRRVDGRATAADIARGLWRRMAVSQAYLALSEVVAHLDLLAAEGRVREEADGELVRLAPV
jgi:glyoxylase-like metal-dependent hydrolase (beta-lactamase superfamily II)